MSQAHDEETMGGGPASADEADRLRAIERGRLRSLVSKDMEAAGALHADDFQLITPGGGEYSKERYLGEVGSGEVNYLIWEPISPIDVRLYGTAAVLRYRAQIEGIMGGQHIDLDQYWHTDVYEQRDGRWQVVWSHATRIK